MFPVDFPLIQAMLESNSMTQALPQGATPGPSGHGSPGSGARYFRAHDVSSDLPGLEGNLREPGGHVISLLVQRRVVYATVGELLSTSSSKQDHTQTHTHKYSDIDGATIITTYIFVPMIRMK